MIVIIMTIMIVVAVVIVDNSTPPDKNTYLQSNKHETACNNKNKK